MDVPKRRFEFSAKIGADSMDDLVRELKAVLFDIRISGSTGSTFGASGCGGQWKITEDESITHESYMAAVELYLKSCNEESRGIDRPIPSGPATT